MYQRIENRALVLYAILSLPAPPQNALSLIRSQLIIV